MKDGPRSSQVEGVDLTASHPLPAVTAVRTLDAAAVFDAHGDLLWRHLQRLGVREPDLADALQDALLVIHRKLSSYDASRPIEGWLYGICVKVAASYRRRAHVRREQSDAGVPDRADERGVDPEAQMVSQQSRARLDVLLDRLDPEKRAVLVMFELEEMPCERIAALLGVPVGTVYSRLHAARREIETAARRRAP